MCADFNLKPTDKVYDLSHIVARRKAFIKNSGDKRTWESYVSWRSLIRAGFNIVKLDDGNLYRICQYGLRMKL